MPDSANPPNIVLIISDDMGYADVPGFGERTEIPMPALERLQREGAALLNAYVSAPICVPSRMGMFTGRHQARWGVYTNVYRGEAYEAWQQQKVIAQYFKEAGYHTALIGKWHLAGNGRILDNPPEYLPDAKGWDEIEVIPGGMAQYFDTPLYLGGGRMGTAPEYATDHFGKRAADYIRRQQANPFLLTLAFNCPHAPLHSEDADVAAFGALDGYDKARYQNPAVPHRGLQMEDRDPPMDRQVYAGMMRAMDRNIGRVLDALDECGLTDNTLVIYINDNGGPALDSEVHSYNQACNAPYRGHKMDVLEGGIRVPMLARFPGRIEAGRSYHGLCSGMDILPTAFAAAGVAPDLPDPLDGVDLLPFLAGDRDGSPHETLEWLCYFYGRQRAQAGIRRDQWKLHQTCGLEEGPVPENWALYDVVNDPGELHDLAAQHPELVRELRTRWSAWRATMQAPPAAN